MGLNLMMLAERGHNQTRNWTGRPWMKKQANKANRRATKATIAEVFNDEAEEIVWPEYKQRKGWVW